MPGASGQLSLAEHHERVAVRMQEADLQSMVIAVAGPPDLADLSVQTLRWESAIGVLVQIGEDTIGVIGVSSRDKGDSGLQRHPRHHLARTPRTAGPPAAATTPQEEE